MKAIPLLLIACFLFFACKKDQATQQQRPVSAPLIIPSNPVLSGVLGTGHNIVDSIHLTSSIAWHLSGLVYVDSADVLIIDAGTVIRGDLSTTIGAPGGGLVVTRGAKILAQGTVTSPIIFTSAATIPASGDWAGVVIIGNASSNLASRVQVEGIPPNPPANATFGGTVGTNDNDNSGVLKYVRLEYGGYELSTDNEINGLSLAGVGNGTVIEYVEVFKALDDSFEWFGGTVNCSHLIGVAGRDDIFDFDNGYRGTVSYALGLVDFTRADRSQSNGIESDNLATGDSTAVPFTKPVINYMTLIGLPTQAQASITTGLPSGIGRYGRSAQFRRSSRFDIRNSIFMGFNSGIALVGTIGNTPCTYTNGQSILDNNLVHGFVDPFSVENPLLCLTTASFTSLAIFNNQAYNGADPNDGILLENPFNRPTNSRADNFFPQPGGDADVYQAGAFTYGGVDWTANWSRYQ